MTTLVHSALTWHIPESIHRRLASVVIALSLCSLAGWLFGVPLLTRFVAGRPAMSVVTALALLLAACALANIKERAVARRLAGIQVLTGLVIGGAHWGMDLAYTPTSWLWTSHLTGLAIAVSGLSTWLIASGRLREGQGTAFLTLLMAALVGMGHMIPAADLYDYLPGSGVAIPTILCFLTLSTGQLLSFPGNGITAALRSESIAGRAGLRLISIGVVVPLLVCLLAIWAYQRQMLDGESAVMFVSWCAMALLGITVWRLAIVADKAEQAKRLAEQQQNCLRQMMIAALTHDLRNPLQAALLATELVQTEVHEKSTAETLAGIARSHRRIDRLLRSLLDNAALESGQSLALRPSPFDLVALVRQVIEEDDEHLQGRVVLEGAPAQGWWDYDALFRVVENLLMNAVKYGHSGSRISCSIQAISGDRVRLAVSNQGDPIPPAEWELVFQPFSRGKGALDSSQVGWGVGLAYARTILALQGGSIGVESSNEEATTFVVTLPIDSRRIAAGDTRKS